MRLDERVQVTLEGPVALVRLDRAEKHNALDFRMFKAIVESQRRLRRMREVRAVVLSGSGVDFCTGLDVKSAMRRRGDMVRLLWKWLPGRPNLAQQAGMGWRRLPVPVIAAIQGRCWGGGMQIALGADFRIAQPGASLSIMEAQWGLIPDMGGTLALRELVGRDQAMRLAMTAETLSGEQALELGLVSAVDDDPASTALELARAIADRSPDVVGAVKRLYRKSWNRGSRAALARETGYQLRILSGPNRAIAARRARGEDRDYRPPKRW
jgi:enoyl-CoA hydratase/carnithine racemase